MSKRQSRYKRNPDPKPIYLQERDISIIEKIYRYRFLTSDQVETLVGGDKFHLRKRLRALYDHKYLDKPEKQKFLFGNPDIYGLGDKGATLLETKYKVKLSGLDWREKNRDVQMLFIQHRLMISEFFTTLEKACELKPDIEIDTIIADERELKRNARIDGAFTSINPDGFFVLRDPKGKIPYFLECDRSTETNVSRYMPKLRKYFVWWNDGQYEQAYNFKMFRLLTLTISEQRRDNLLQGSKQVDNQQQGFRGFWFATEKDFNSKQPLTILNKIWRNPRDPKKRFSLLD